MAAIDQVPGRISRPAAAVIPSRVSGSWSWILQRITAVLLLAFLGAHWYIAHYGDLGQSITFDRVGIRLQNPLLVFVDSGMLAIVLYHALNGTRNVIVDFNIGKTWERVLSIGLFVIGIIVFVYGINALLPFTTGSALFYR